ncbi:hypothetical protein [Pseudomonas silesiensis]
MFVTLRARIILLVGLCLTLLALALISTAIKEMSGLSQRAEGLTSASMTQAIEERVAESVRFQSSGVQVFFRDALRVGEASSAEVMRIMSLSRSGALTPEHARAYITGQLQASLQANPTFISTYVVFEPNAFDGQDARFAGQSELGSNELGRFAPVWFRQSGGKMEQVTVQEKSKHDYLLAAVQKEVLIGLALTVFGLVVIWLASRSIVRPLQAMSRPDLPKAAPPTCKPWSTSARTSIRSQRRCTR